MAQRVQSMVMNTISHQLQTPVRERGAAVWGAKRGQRHCVAMAAQVRHKVTRIEPAHAVSHNVDRTVWKLVGQRSGSGLDRRSSGNDRMHQAKSTSAQPALNACPVWERHPAETSVLESEQSMAECHDRWWATVRRDAAAARSSDPPTLGGHAGPIPDRLGRTLQQAAK
eukprot:CAMPEP_0196778964 /NCGR_PEP_ID=MMETSP1104-20130614/6105_1 /TAXON_ID=33652 /ORGANISM="Cafeteria sp., Strain Caron Lab Isolate" /LENGTH=168 /DNA_ID=CAMNT_0042149139 /DNA_START=312 /DNA_END=815 /DNA_ORIENTATION=-